MKIKFVSHGVDFSISGSFWRELTGGLDYFKLRLAIIRLLDLTSIIVGWSQCLIGYSDIDDDDLALRAL
jgi:hypothetical protein